MKKITYLLSLILLVGFTANAQVNLVVNPSFEDGFTGWEKGPSKKYEAPEVKSDGAQDGSNYVSYVAPSATTGFYQDIAITPGKTYTLSFYYKATGDDSDARIWSYLMDADNKYYSTEAADDPLKTNDGYLPPASDWTKHEVTFTAPASMVFFRLAVRAYRGDNVNVSYDNFSLVEEGSSSDPAIMVSVTSLDFNSPVGTTSDIQSVSVVTTNLNGTATYNVSGADAAMFSATGTLNEMGGLINVVFNPTSEGTKTATLTVSQGSLSKEISLTGITSGGANPYGLDDSAPVTSIFENFESASGIPAGWVSYAEQGEDRNWEYREYDANHYLQMSAFKGNGTYQTLLISPAIDFDNLSTKDLKFDWKSGYTNGATLSIYVMSKDGNKTEISTIVDDQNPSGYGTQFNTEVIDLSAFSGVKFIVFEYNGVAGSETSTYQVDNIKVPSTETGLATPTYNELSVWTKDNNVMFNADANEMIEVYNIAGQKIINKLSSEGLNKVYIPTSGVVIVKVGNHVSKVIL